MLIKPISPIWQPGHPLANGCVLFCPFLEGTGTTITDYAAGAHHGTSYNSVWGSGIYGAQLDCTAASSYVSFPDHADMRFAGAHTIAWLGVLTGNGIGNSSVIGKSGTVGCRASSLQQFSSNMYHGWSSDGTDLTQEAPASFTKSDPNLDLLVTVYTPSVSVVTYQNGTAIKTSSTSIPAAFYNSNGLGWKVHTRGDVIDFTLGITTGVAMWGRALSAGEVASLAIDFWAPVRQPWQDSRWTSRSAWLSDK